MGELGDLVDRFVSERERLHMISRATRPNYLCALRLFVDVADGRPVRELARKDVETWLIAQHHLAPATRRSRLSVLRMFSAWLVDEGAIDEPLTAGVQAPRQPRSVPRAMPRDDVGQVIAACPDARARAIVALMVGEGLRCCEVAGLELGDWDRGEQTVIVRGKGGHERIVPVTDETTVTLGEYLDQWPSLAGPLVRSYRRPQCGLAADTISGLVSDWMTAAGVKRRQRDGVSAHALRHTCASDVLDTCGDLRVVQELLGHQHLQTTAIYLRRAGLGKMREAMAGRRYEADAVGAA